MFSSATKRHLYINNILILYNLFLAGPNIESNENENHGWAHILLKYFFVYLLNILQKQVR